MTLRDRCSTKAYQFFNRLYDLLYSVLLEDYDPSRSPVSYDAVYLPFLVYMVRCLAGMFPYGLIPSFSTCVSYVLLPPKPLLIHLFALSMVMEKSL